MSCLNRARLATTWVIVALVVALAIRTLAGRDYMAPRTAFGVPDLSGIWQAAGSHHWNIEPHAASHGPVVELGAIFAVPAGLGIVRGGEIPYTATARARQQENARNWVERDPAVKCYMPGIPRATYQPYPFQIVQAQEYILFAYEFAGASRVVYMNRPDLEAPVGALMGHSLGSWDGETLVIDVTAQMPDTWFDRNGNHHSDQIHVVERYTATSPYHLNYQATIEDSEVYTRPWSLSLPLYRRIDENMQLLEYNCVPFVQGLMYGDLSAATPTYRAFYPMSEQVPIAITNRSRANDLVDEFLIAFSSGSVDDLVDLFVDEATPEVGRGSTHIGDRDEAREYFNDMFSGNSNWRLEISARNINRTGTVVELSYSLTAAHSSGERIETFIG